MKEGRPQLHDDPAKERRRRQYRMSKRRRYERDRHAKGQCKAPCALAAPLDVVVRVPVPRKNGDGYVWLPA